MPRLGCSSLRAQLAATAPTHPKDFCDKEIEMLATCAKADPALKKFIKAVVSSLASREQLKQFHGHVRALDVFERKFLHTSIIANQLSSQDCLKRYPGDNEMATQRS